MVTCPPVPHHVNASADTESAMFGTYVNYTCNTGMWFIDSSFHKVIYCNDSGVWNTTVPPCVGKLEIMVNHMLNVLYIYTHLIVKINMAY